MWLIVFIRLQIHTAAVMALNVSRVLYPGLKSHPDHALAKKQMVDFGSVLIFDVKGDAEDMRKVVDKLEVFKIAFGTGFTQSISNPAWLFYNSCNRYFHYRPVLKK